ncbi:hypothetical protein L6452_27196 [Arctium lappa]|uniref:Uncharacterized protein n=1 Tax=Arctium lappa TaxID=4217 RepID=A0ACB8ZWV1_ARCLA|nr:hypothetical protein L6452_27196 [Arctium lappa]
MKGDPDHRFVFQFDGEQVCSPQVFQIQRNIRQPIFTCKFRFDSTTADDCNQGSTYRFSYISALLGIFYSNFDLLVEIRFIRHCYASSSKEPRSHGAGSRPGKIVVPIIYLAMGPTRGLL